MSNVLAQYVDAKGNPFQLLGDKDHFVQWLNDHIKIPDDDDGGDYDLSACVMPHTDDQHPTPEERQADKDSLQKFFFYTEADWLKLLQDMPKKKNGTLSKGRMHVLIHLDTFAYYLEDSYCWKMPGVKIRNVSDDTAELEIGDYKEKY